jgi:aldehyde:ferredoxin oxidoreductase
MTSASPPPGYHGRAWLIDVSAHSCEALPLDENLLRQSLGGSGLGTRLLLDLKAADHAPLAPPSPLVFAFSPLVGSPLTTSAKFAVVHKSPLTDRINDSLASSAFAIRGKSTGADALVIIGRAAELSILVLDNGALRLEPATDLAGATIGATEKALAKRFGSEFAFAVIGPAGERQIPFATVSHDGRHAGRGGAGAMLGSKNIKAIAVRGGQRVESHDPTALHRYAKQLSERSFGPATAKYRELGTAANLLVFNRLGTLPTRNFQQGHFEQAIDLAPETLALSRSKTRASCAACTIGCEHLYALDTKDGSVGVRLEYENLFALGPLCGVGNASDVLSATRRCDELGLDTISTGGTIAFAMECGERGLWDVPWLRFGDGAALLRAIDELASGSTSVGQALALGSRRLAQHIGGDALSMAAQVKGLELPGYEPRTLQTMALGLAVGTRGADHNRSGAYEADFSARADRLQLTPASAALAIETEDRAALMDSLILCKFLRGVFTDFYAEAASMLHLITGWDLTAEELHRTARGIISSKKAFNVAAGWTPAEDTLPARFFDNALTDQPDARLTRPQLTAAITEYNRLRGWTDEGWLR